MTVVDDYFSQYGRIIKIRLRLEGLVRDLKKGELKLINKLK